MPSVKTQEGATSHACSNASREMATSAIEVEAKRGVAILLRIVIIILERISAQEFSRSDR
jgi:hypothetical protein